MLAPKKGAKKRHARQRDSQPRLYGTPHIRLCRAVSDVGKLDVQDRVDPQSAGDTSTVKCHQHRPTTREESCSGRLWRCGETYKIPAVNAQMSTTFLYSAISRRTKYGRGSSRTATSVTMSSMPVARYELTWSPHVPVPSPQVYGKGVQMRTDDRVMPIIHPMTATAVILAMTTKARTSKMEQYRIRIDSLQRLRLMPQNIWTGIAIWQSTSVSQRMLRSSI